MVNNTATPTQCSVDPVDIATWPTRREKMGCGASSSVKGEDAEEQDAFYISVCMRTIFMDTRARTGTKILYPSEA